MSKHRLEAERRSSTCGLRLSARILFLPVLWVLSACVLVQAYLAGEAAMVAPELWGAHVAFVRLFAPLTVLLVLLAWAGKRSLIDRGLAVATPASMAVQFFSAEARNSATLSWLPGVHALGAMALVLACAILCWRTRPRATR